MFDKLSIFPATRAQAIESRKRSYETWGKAIGYPLEAYLDRKNTMDGLEIAADGRWTTWVLAPWDDPETIDFMCSCESMRREVTVFKKTSSDEVSSDQRIGYGIASVYTPPHKRGKGYAKHMMRLLHWLAPATAHPFTFPELEWGRPPVIPQGFGNGVLSVLYSDVGPQFYKICGPIPGGDGWTVTPQIVTTWDVGATLGGPAQPQEAEWTLLGKEQLKDYWERDSRHMLDIHPKISSSTEVAFSFFPRKGLAEYLHRRIEWLVDQIDPSPTYYGVRFGREIDSEDVVSSFASWTYELLPKSPRTLLITRLRCPKELLPGMLKKIAGYANSFGIERIQVWNLPQDLEVEGGGGTSVPAEEHLASVKWYEGDSSTIEWLNNEKFAWC